MVPKNEETIDEEARERKERFEWMQMATRELAQAFHSRFPNAEKKSWKYYLFNTVRWD